VLVLDPPPPGETHLRRRVGEFHGFVRELVASVERQTVDGERLGSLWDIEGDPAGLRLARLWGYVAESVAAYTELSAGEGYLPTAQDWTDLRRIAALVGFKPRPPIAAQGWVMAELEKGSDPLVPATTRLQAPASPGHAAQTFEVIADTQLHAEWAALTATWVPQPAVPVDRTMRFLGDPGFHAADRVLFLLEKQIGTLTAGSGWFDFWGFLVALREFTWDFGMRGAAQAQPLALAGVGGTSSELGTTVVSFDRDLDKLLCSPTKPYAAYRVVATAAAARQLESVLWIPPTGPPATAQSLPLTTEPAIATNQLSIILDRPLEDLSAHRLVAIVDWAKNACDVVEVASHAFVDWDVAPGTPTRVSQLTFAKAVPTLGSPGPITVYVLDRRVVARHYVLPAKQPLGPPQLRLYPPPSAKNVPQRIAVAAAADSGPVDWEVFACTKSANQETTDGGVPSGLIVDLPEAAPSTLVIKAPASANLLRVRHGKTTSVVLGSGDATKPGQQFTTPDAPIASDLDEGGNPMPSILLRVAGVRWDEVPSLFAQGGAEVFATRLGSDGSETVDFGDGSQGARLPTGRGNVAATYRVGGGTAGEVASGAIDTLLGSVRGVKKVRGAGPTEGGSDQDAESHLRRLAPTRARAFGRAVSAEDLVDLSVGYPGISHAATWNGDGPPGCACGGSGLHLAFIRTGTAGPRPPLPPEIDSLSGYLDARRDATVPLCVCAGFVTRPRLTAELALDPRRDPAVVSATVAAALIDPEGDLAPDQRLLGQPLDRSDVFAVIHRVTGVVGVTSLDLPGANGELGRRGALAYELLAPSTDPSVAGASA
jgi:hypothetical protein